MNIAFTFSPEQTQNLNSILKEHVKNTLSSRELLEDFEIQMNRAVPIETEENIENIENTEDDKDEE